MAGPRKLVRSSDIALSVISVPKKENGAPQVKVGENQTYGTPLSEDSKKLCCAAHRR
jgi:hypothetical protein